MRAWEDTNGKRIKGVFGDFGISGTNASAAELFLTFCFCFRSFMGSSRVKGKGSHDIISFLFSCCFGIHHITLLYLHIMTNGFSFVY
jgi:hypothetical protein